MIPKNIFQTHKSMRYIQSKPKLLNAVNSWRKLTGDFNYYFYNDKMCDIFMQNNFDEKVNKAYSMLPMKVMKADLWRYCVLYKYGGIYADTDTVCKVNPNVFINNAYINISPEPGHPYFCQWTFSAPANSPILKKVIDLSVERILNTEIKGEHIIHYLTGPECFTDGIMQYFRENNIPVSNNLSVYNKLQLENVHVFNPSVFHDRFITHLYAGSDKDGWKRERDLKLK